MNTPPDKPPTRESVDAAKRFAASLPALPALPEPQEKQPIDYARGFVDGYQKAFEKGYQAGLRKAQEIITK